MHKYQILASILLCIFSTITWSETVSLEIKPGITANAQYEQGDLRKPVVLLLHGFLQTNNYMTLSNINDAIVENNYSLLSPIISLGINNRDSSLPCQATHLHTMEDDLDEINQWMHWLKNKGHSKVIFIGHSFGSVQAVAYLERRQDDGLPVITKFIGVSLVDSEFVPDIKRRDQDRTIAQHRIHQGDTDIQTYRLYYCHLYRAPSKAFLSYASWSSERILAALKSFSKRIKLISVLGSKDKRVPANWPAKQKNAGVEVKIIKGANHFFGGSQQISLLELLDEILAE